MRNFVGLSLLLGAAIVFPTLACRDDPGTGGGSSDGGETSTGGNGGTPSTGGNGGSPSTGGNGGTPSTGGMGGGTGGTGGAGPECGVAGDCPGADTECSTRTCDNGVCGFDVADPGTELTQQTDGDCTLLVCDGAGDVMSEADPNDLPDDSNDCTFDDCDGTDPIFTNADLGDFCIGPGNEQFCNDSGVCVECNDGFDCTSGVCTAQNTCAAVSCGDFSQNGDETDIDCGGSICPGCAVDQTCIDDADCLSGDCQGTCQPTCTDGERDQDETDVDCGGAACGQCGVGLGCDIDDDCMSGSCSGTCDEYQLRISEARGHGPGGSGDDFVELYNPLLVDVTLTSDIEVASRSDTAGTYTVRWTSAGQSIPTHGHLLLVGGSYSGATVADDVLGSGITDQYSLVVQRAGAPLDALCMYCGTTDPYMGDPTYFCEGTAFKYTGCGGTTDKSLERLPGGTNGSAQDNGDNATDFHILTPSDPQNVNSPATP